MTNLNENPSNIIWFPTYKNTKKVKEIALWTFSNIFRSITSYF
jgi:general stress protein 26